MRNVSYARQIVLSATVREANRIMFCFPHALVPRVDVSYFVALVGLGLGFGFGWERELAPKSRSHWVLELIEAPFGILQHDTVRDIIIHDQQDLPRSGSRHAHIRTHVNSSDSLKYSREPVSTQNGTQSQRATCAGNRTLYGTSRDAFSYFIPNALRPYYILLLQ
jgi:hypothetical protein